MKIWNELPVFVFLPSPVFTHLFTPSFICFLSFPDTLRTLLLAASAISRAATAGKLDRRRNNASYRPQHRIQIGFVLSTSCSESCGDNGTGQRWCWMGADKDWEGGGLQRRRTSNTKVWQRQQLRCDDVQKTAQLHRMHILHTECWGMNAVWPVGWLV